MRRNSSCMTSGKYRIKEVKWSTNAGFIISRNLGAVFCAALCVWVCNIGHGMPLSSILYIYTHEKIGQNKSPQNKICSNHECIVREHPYMTSATSPTTSAFPWPPRVQTSYMDVKNAYGNPGSAPYSLLVIVTLHTFMI